MDETIEIKRDPITGIECIQAGNEKDGDDNKRDNANIENNPGMFAAEQTWPTEDEINEASKTRKESMSEMDMGMDEVKIPKEGMDGLGDMMEKMTIDIVGKEHGNQSDDDFGDSEDSDEEEYDEAEHF